MEHAAGRTAAGSALIDAELEALRFHWDTAYAIEWGDEHGWRARRLDGLGGWLTAASPDKLYDVIAADYALRPVPRSVTPVDRS
jgi:hypothetical protein